MIKYRLVCKNCDLSFDSWFASSQEYEKLKKRKLLNCHNCESKKVEKSLMAPKLVNKARTKESLEQNIKIKQINKKIKEYQKFIKCSQIPDLLNIFLSWYYRIASKYLTLLIF